MLAFAACTPPNRDLQPGHYRAVVDSPGGDLPFTLAVTRAADGYTLAIVDGERPLPATDLTVQGGKLTATWPGGRSTLEATIADGTLRGEIGFVAADGRRHPIAFKAVHGQDWRFYEQAATDNFDAAGRWDVVFTDDRGAEVRGTVEFEQKFERVSGLVRTPDGELRVSGEAHGDKLLLSHFDGQSGALWLARLNKQGGLEGDRWSLPLTHQKFAAVRSATSTP